MKSDAMTQDQYVQFVHESFASAAKASESVVFTNRGLFHAATVLRETIIAAQHDLKIVSGCLPSTAYDADLLRAASRRIDGTIRVILTDPAPFAELSALRHCKREIRSGKIAVRFLCPYDSFVPTHFALCDGKHLRAEQDQREKSAIIVLNASTEISAQFTDLFESYWKVASSPNDTDFDQGQQIADDNSRAVAG